MKKNLAAIIFFVLLTLVFVWPLPLHLTSRVIDNHDGLLIAWYLNWVIHSLTTGYSGISRLFDANIFYPYHLTLAYSDMMIPEALLALPLWLIFREPLLSYNLTFLLGFILTAFAGYLLGLEMTKKFSLALLAGSILAFSPIHLHYMAHLQLFSLWPFLLALYFLLRQNFRMFIVFFWKAALTTGLFLYFLLTVIVLRLIFFPDQRRFLIRSTVVGGLITFPFLLPYLLVSKQFNYVRPITDAIHFSLQFPELLVVGWGSRLSALFPPAPFHTPAFAGLAVLLLLFATIWQLRDPLRHFSKISPEIKFGLALTIVGFIFALGPALHLRSDTVHIGPFRAIPLPYVLPYYLVPGFSGFRTPSRWIILSLVGLVYLALRVLRDKLSPVLVAGLIILIIWEVNWPFHYFPVQPRGGFPPEASWLAVNYPGAPIIQFPIYRWDDEPGVGLETLREYYSTLHWHPMYNGYSGFSPPEWEKRVRWLQQEFPSNDSLNYLRTVQIKLVLAPADWSEKISSFSALTKVAVFPQTIVYELN